MGDTLEGEGYDIVMQTDTVQKRQQFLIDNQEW